MAQIKIYSDASKGCIFFEGSTVEPKFLGIVECALHPTLSTRLVITRNDRFRPDGVTPRTIFRKLNPARVQNEAGENLMADLNYTRIEVCDYINEVATAVEVPSSGTVFQLGDTLDFTRDETITSILFSNGDHHGINAIKAIDKPNGKLGIYTMRGDVELYELDFSIATINGQALTSTTLPGVVNELNAFFTASAVGGAITAAPVYTQADGVPVVWQPLETHDPSGSALFANPRSGTEYHGARVYTNETINEPGEYFTFEVSNTVSGGGPLFGIGLYSVANGDLAEVQDSTLSNSGHHGFFFSNWLYNYSGYSAPWTTYGSHSNLSYGPGWQTSSKMFRYSDANLAFRDGDNALIKCGITDEGFVGIWYYDVEIEGRDGGYGARSNDWILLARSSSPLPEGEYGLMVKIPSTSGRIMSQPLRFATDAAAPTLYYRYIESPDGNFEYPLFATAEEANYVDQQNGGSGTSHEHMYADDTTPGTVWHMPDTGGEMSGTTAPVDTAEITYTEIPTQDDSNFVPSAFGPATLTVNEGDVLNYQLAPQDVTYTTVIGGQLPAGWQVSADARLVGTAPEVTGDNVSNPSDEFDVVVFRTNEFGMTYGTLTVTVNNLTAPAVNTGDFTVDTGSIVGGVLQEDSLADLSMTIEEGDRIIVPKEWVDAHIQPNALDALEKVYMGVLKDGTNTDAITLGDFNCCFRWEGASQSTFHYVRMNDQLGASTANISFSNSGASIYDYAFEIYNGDLWLIGCNMNALNTEPAAGNGGSFSRTLNCGPLTDNGLTSPFTVKVGTHVGTILDLDDALTSEEITKVDIPEPAAPAIETPWTKALDFSGSSERAELISGSHYYNPMLMDYQHVLTSAPGTAGNTSSDTAARPWATAVVFSPDGNNSNQHIWNIGEGGQSLSDNIYLRMDASRNLYFGWGRDGALNEYYLAKPSAGSWNGVYVGFNGTRLSGSDATPANLSAAFDIRLMFNTGNSTWGFNPNPTAQGWGTWTSSGGRMDRSVTGWMNIGGRGTNRSFHGKVASFVTTTLKRGSAMPDATEIEEMITDPVGWLNDYKVGEAYRPPHENFNNSNFSINNQTSAGATQVYLMGDGSNDSYSNMIRNQVMKNDQNYTKLNLLSMVSNDIQTVNISGLT